MIITCMYVCRYVGMYMCVYIYIYICGVSLPGAPDFSAGPTASADNYTAIVIVFLTYNSYTFLYYLILYNIIQLYYIVCFLYMMLHARGFGGGSERLRSTSDPEDGLGCHMYVCICIYIYVFIALYT